MLMGIFFQLFMSGVVFNVMIAEFLILFYLSLTDNEDVYSGTNRVMATGE